MTRPAASSSSATLVSGEFPLTEEDFHRISVILREDSGIQLREGRAALVYSRLAKRLRQLGLSSFSDYIGLISEEDGVAERRTMLRALTTNVTRFFREPHHFEHLKTRLETKLVPHAKRGGRVRIWSAGCSTGEEPYSIAMTVLAAMPDAAGYDVKILATDIDTNVIATAKAGAYDADAQGQLPPGVRNHLSLNPSGEGCQVSSAVQNLVSFRELNLMSHWPMKGKFDAIFCRNVAIYFDDATQERLWSRFGDVLETDGRLYVGHSERINDPRFDTDGLTIYRQKQGAA